MSKQLTIEGRYVQGGLTMVPQKDYDTDLPKLKDGQPVLGAYIGVAIPKQINVNGMMVDNPKIGEYYAVFEAQARESFPHLYTSGQNSHPRFAMKWQDGDGLNSSGKSVKDVPGFAGHWVIKCSTQLKAPTCWLRNSQGALQQLAEPEKIIKRGHYVAVSLTIAGNGVEQGGKAVPGLYVTPELLLYVAPGEEIITGPDPNNAFAGISSAAPPVAAGPSLSSPPPPSHAVPLASSGPAAMPSGGPPLPGGPAAMPSGGPPLPGGPAMPQAQYAPTASAQGASVQNMLDAGWTIDTLLAQGHIVHVT